VGAELSADAALSVSVQFLSPDDVLAARGLVDMFSPMMHSFGVPQEILDGLKVEAIEARLNLSLRLTNQQINQLRDMAQQNYSPEPPPNF
jgi:hypothetical protein